jgi:signal transduction histidine kinase
MANHAPLNDDQLAPETRLQEFLVWLTRTTFAFVLLLLLAFILLGQRQFAISAGVLVGLGILLVSIQGRLRRGQPETAVITLSIGLFAAILLFKLSEPVSPSTLAVAPLLAVGLALPYVQQEMLRRLMLVAWVIALVITVLNELAAPVSELPVWVSVGFRAGSFAVVMALLLLLLWQFNSRLLELLARLRSSNAALRTNEEALQSQFDQLEIVYRLTSMLSRAVALDAIYDAALEGVQYALKADRAAILLFDEDDVVRFKAGRGLSDTYLSAAEGQSPWPRNTQLPQPILVEDVEADASLEALLPAIRAEGIRALGFIPLAHQGGLLGKLMIYYDQTHVFADEEVQLAQTIAGQVVFALGRKRAEDERRALERSLLEAQKLESLAMMAGGIAHDFNNVLAIILGNTDLARMELPPDSPAQELLAPIAGAVQRATALTQQMLAYSGRGHFLIERLDLSALLMSMQGQIRAASGDHIAMNYQLAPDLPPIDADPSQMGQLVLSLVNNAIEAIGQAEKSISVSTSLQSIDRVFMAEAYLVPDEIEPHYVALDVADAGSGMDEATLARIFEPFFTTKFMGRGLGLAAVLGIVRGHHGAIRVRSVVGQGTSVTVLFPVAEETAPAGDAHTSDQANTEAPAHSPPPPRPPTLRRFWSPGSRPVGVPCAVRRSMWTSTS